MTANRAWLRSLSRPLTVFAVSRVGLFLIAYLSLIYIPLNDPLQQFDTVQYAKADNLWTYAWGPWWDGGWYYKIISAGYDNVANPWGQRDTVFFPLYPVTVSAINTFVANVPLAAFLTSNVLFCGALVILYKLIGRRSDVQLAWRSSLLLAVYPFALFYAAMYTESLFLLTVVAAFYFGERKQWAWAAVFAALSSATRLVGVFTVVGLAVLYLEQIEFKWRRVRYDVLWLPLGFLGLAGFMLFLANRFGSPWLFVTNQNAPGWSGWDQANILRDMGATVLGAIRPPQNLLSGSFNAIAFLNFTTLVFMLAVLALGVVGYFWQSRPNRLSRWHRMGLRPVQIRLGWLVWGLLVTLMSISAWTSMGRYSATVFPAFVVLATYLDSPGKFSYFVYLSAMLLGLLTIMYTHGFWVA